MMITLVSSLLGVGPTLMHRTVSSPKLSGLAQDNFGPMKGKGIGRNFKIESFQMLSIIFVISLHIAFCFKIR